MSRVSHVLKDIKDAFNGFDNIDAFYLIIESNDYKLREFIALFEDVQDSRMERKYTYSTMTVVGIVFLGLLHNMDT